MVFNAARQDIEIAGSGRIAPIRTSTPRVAAMVSGYGILAYDQLQKPSHGHVGQDTIALQTGSTGRLTDEQIHYAVSDVTHLREVSAPSTQISGRRGTQRLGEQEWRSDIAQDLRLSPGTCMERAEDPGRKQRRTGGDGGGGGWLPPATKRRPE